MNPLTRDDLFRTAGRSDFDASDIEQWLRTANCDADEGAIWLPYYKLSIALLASACGSLHAAAEELELATPNPVLRALIDRGVNLMLAAMRINGIGPKPSAASVASVDDQLKDLTDWISQQQAKTRAELAEARGS